MTIKKLVSNEETMLRQRGLWLTEMCVIFYVCASALHVSISV